MRENIRQVRQKLSTCSLRQRTKARRTWPTHLYNPAYPEPFTVRKFGQERVLQPQNNPIQSRSLNQEGGHISTSQERLRKPSLGLESRKQQTLDYREVVGEPTSLNGPHPGRLISTPELEGLNQRVAQTDPDPHDSWAKHIAEHCINIAGTGEGEGAQEKSSPVHVGWGHLFTDEDEEVPKWLVRDKKVSQTRGLVPVGNSNSHASSSGTITAHQQRSSTPFPGTTNHVTPTITQNPLSINQLTWNLALEEILHSPVLDPATRLEFRQRLHAIGLEDFNKQSVRITDASPVNLGLVPNFSYPIEAAAFYDRVGGHVGLPVYSGEESSGSERGKGTALMSISEIEALVKLAEQNLGILKQNVGHMVGLIQRCKPNHTG